MQKKKTTPPGGGFYLYAAPKGATLPPWEKKNTPAGFLDPKILAGR